MFVKIYCCIHCINESDMKTVGDYIQVIYVTNVIIIYKYQIYCIMCYLNCQIEFINGTCVTFFSFGGDGKTLAFSFEIIYTFCLLQLVLHTGMYSYTSTLRVYIYIYIPSKYMRKNKQSFKTGIVYYSICFPIYN